MTHLTRDESPRLTRLDQGQEFGQAFLGFGDGHLDHGFGSFATMRDVYQAGALHQGLPHFLQRFLEVVGDDEPPFILFCPGHPGHRRPGRALPDDGHGNEPGDREE